ncbi:hypothetical protein LB507_009250 [Fusarium sp. FIESC RH6]|nr:hypothetical protein LB507_009250 [Fusarium sp. FIESC RH6]
MVKIWPTDDGSGDPYSPYPSWDLGEERSRPWESDEPGDDTCFKGYIEGVEVLYSTNTIFISSEALFTRLPRNTPAPPRLFFLQSLEIVWNLETAELPRGWALHRSDTAGIHQGRLKQILEITLDSLFRIRRLHLVLVLRTTFRARLYLDHTLHLLDAFAESLCRLKKLKVPLQISTTSTVYKQLYKQAKVVAMNKEFVEADVEFQFWRFVDGKCALGPRDPEVYCKIDGATVENGYWFVRGDKDDDRARQAWLSGF